MKNNPPTILHHKYSLEDGHVTKQVSNVDGYRGIMMTDKLKEYRKSSRFKSVLSLKTIINSPDVLKRYNVVGIHIHHGTLASKFKFLKEEYGTPLFISFRGNDATAYPKKKNI